MIEDDVFEVNANCDLLSLSEYERFEYEWVVYVG